MSAKTTYATTNAELREKLPKMVARSEAGSRASAIHLFCRECMGGSRKDAVSCKARDCFLWPYRPKSSVAPEGE